MLIPTPQRPSFLPTFSVCLVSACLGLGGASCATGVGSPDEALVNQNGESTWNAGGDGGAAGATTSTTSNNEAGGLSYDAGAPPEQPMCEGELTAVIRDFRIEHPDFENYVGDGAFVGLVQSELGSDEKPAYAHSGGTSQTTGPEQFEQWYHDTPGQNETVTVTLPLTETTPGVYVYDNTAFYPVDQLGFGNEGKPHNFHFTTEIHTSFTYEGGEVFTFTGDDDLWLFINGRLAIDLGGLHPKLTQSVSLDAVATELGLQVGGLYSMSIFHAERHTPESNFHIETTIGCFQPVPH